MKKLVLKLIKQYQKHLAPINFGVDTCRYKPSCSHYTFDAVNKYGIVKGSLMGGWRVLRCNPFSKGGHDPVK